MSAKKIAKLAILAALSVLFVYISFPLFPAVPWLRYDAADIPILIGTFLYGPLAGVLLTVVASVLQGLTVAAGEGWIGILMHVLATSTLVVVAGVLYRIFHTRKGAILALVCGCAAMTVVMIPLNYIFTPILYGATVEAVTALLPWIVLFNLTKSVINAAVTFVAYKTVAKLFRDPILESKKSAKIAAGIDQTAQK